MATASIDVLPVVLPVDDIPGPPQGQWSYDSYAALPDDGRRYEIVDGVLYMAPAPGTDHQGSVARFAAHLLAHIETKGLGRILVAPTDVELALDVVVQPDVIVVLQANLGIITPSRLIGAPNLLVEIASPSTAGYDRREKQDAYARAGVREYWVADPTARTIELLCLAGDRYRTVWVYQGRAKLPSQVLPGLPVEVDRFFV